TAQEPAKQPVPQPSPATAQASPAPALPVPDPSAAPVAGRRARSLGPAFDTSLLALLPMSDGVWSVFETIESTAILDRMERGDLDITDPDRTGTPLFLADPEELSSIDIASGLAPADSRGAGPTVDLALRRPGDAWRKSFAANDAPGVLQQAYRRHGAPAIAHI